MLELKVGKILFCSYPISAEKKDMKVVIIVSVVVGVVSIAIGLLFLWWLMAKRKGNLCNNVNLVILCILNGF